MSSIRKDIRFLQALSPVAPKDSSLSVAPYVYSEAEGKESSSKSHV